MPSSFADAVRPIEVTFASRSRELHGFLFKPHGNGPFGAVLWNHGSERKPGGQAPLGEVFTSRGYVFFVPHRTGQGRSPGDYVGDLLEQERAANGDDAWSRKLADHMEFHLQDQIAALGYLKSRPFVDAQRIVAAGSSFGGVQAMLAAGESLGLRAAINFSGAAMTWRRSPELREIMLAAARRATVPVMLIQAENDVDLTPSYALADEMTRAAKPHRLVIFPPFGETAIEGHLFCARGSEIWASTVFAFLHETLKHAPSTPEPEMRPD
jgi:carboxymethylenebutenolidase